MTKDLTARLANLTPKQRELLLKKLRSKPNTTKKQTTIASQQRRGTMVPATDSQFQLWVPDNVANELPQYNIPMGLRLHGVLETQQLVAALHAIIVRHEILRTSFHNQDGQLMQKIHDAVVLDVPLVDLQGCAAEKREGEALRIMRADAKRPFQTHTLPLMRATLIRLTAQEHILYVTKHHIISDGWSIGLFYDELLQQYDHLTRHTAPLAPLPIQFSDYALWQQSTESQAQHQKQLNYWQQKLSGELPIFELPADFPRPRIISHQGDVQTCLLPQAMVQQMEAVSQQAGATLSMTLLAVFKLLMLRYTGSTDLLVGTAIANRQRKEIEGLIGLFLNTLVIRTDMSGDPAFLTLLQQVRRSTLEAYDNQDLPYGRLVEAIQPERTTNHNPVFQSYFGMQNYPYATLKAGELRATALPDGYVHTQTSKIDLSLMVYNEGDNLRCVFEYSTDLFRPDTIGRLMGHWQTLIANVAANPAQRLSAYGILTAAEETQIIQSWNESSAPYPHQTLHQRFQEQAERRETAVAVSCTDTQLTYGELDAQTNQLARHLQALGVQRGTFVGILMIESVERVVAVLATLKAGGAYVPLDPAYPKERLSFMLSDTQTPILITQSELLPQLPSHNATNVCLDTVDLSTYSSAALDVPVTPNDLAYVIYTSGSTGKPKGVCCAHAGVQNLLANFDQWQPLEVKQNSAWWTSFNFDVSVYELFAPLMCGAALHIVPSEDRLDIDKFAEWMLHQQIHSAYIPPFMLAPLVARWQANTALPPLQRLLVGVEPISESLLVQMRQLMPDLVIINGYGPTETTVCATLYPVPQQVTHDGNTPIGRPTQNLDLYLLDEQMQPVAVGIPGELYIGGIGVAHGYLNLPGLTAVNFVPNPFNNAQGARLYRTGDLVRYLPDGTLIFVGRRDHQVKLHGYRIELGEIEAQLVKHPDIHESVVTVFEASPNDQRLVAYITADTDMIPQLTLPLLRDYLQQTLPDYMLPSAFVGLEALPQTPNGKVNRKALPEPIDSFAQTNGTAPRTLIEEMVAAMWTQLLGQQKADIFANFFECGGHSLLAIRLLAQIEKQLQVTVPLGQFFTNPTIATLGKHIDAARKSQQQIPITPITPQVQGNCAPLSSAQKRMWILYQLSPRAATYNVPIVLQMEGDLNLEALERTLNEIVARHAILRTTYEMQQGQPISVIHPAQERPLPVYDLTHLSGTEQEQAARQTITHLVSQPFDLTNGPLVRTQIVRLAEKQHILLLATHHIAMDGWSISIFAQEMATLYTAHVQEQSVSLPNLPIQYGDYAIWQQAWMQSDGFQQQLDYWRERLAGEQTVLRLPTDHPLPKEPALVAQGVVHSWHWDKALCQDVIRFAQSEGCTPYIVMLAVLQLLLHRYSGQSNVNVGSPIANRNRPEVAEMIGFFVNTLVITAVFNRVTTFRELLQQVQQEALGAFDRQDMPFDELVKAFQQGQRQVDQQPFFQVMFNFQRGGDNSQIEMPGLSLSFAEGGAQTAKFDLLIEGAEVEGAFGWNLVYRKALFDEETIVTLVAQMEHLLRQVMAAPDEQVNNYALWADDVQARWQDTAVLLQQHPAVKETAVCAWQDVPTARGLAAYIVLENGTDLSAKAVHQYLIAQKSQVVPPNIIFVEQLNGSLPMPPSMDDNQSQDLHTRTQVLSAQAQLAKKKAALSAKKKALLEKMLTRRALSDKKDRPAAIPVRSPNAIIPLSYNQERLWFLQQLSPSAAYNMPFRFEMTFALDVQALQRSVITIIERHEVLRTRFEMMDEQPVQVIHPTDGF
ncbi:MAG: amino acid adenylation domain-containing protein, partial [Chloroflexi bacterium]|nr:amino acid adenylation domain-containing protein [Chloroflexota bacterium]